MSVAIPSHRRSATVVSGSIVPLSHREISTEVMDFREIRREKLGSAGGFGREAV